MIRRSYGHQMPPTGVQPKLNHPTLRGLVCQWLFNENGGSNVVGFGSKPRLATINGLASHALWRPPGVLYDGDATAYSLSPHATALINTAACSLCAWVTRSTTASDNSEILAVTGDTIKIRFQSSNIPFAEIYNGAFVAVTGPALTNGRPYFLVLTFTVGLLSFYINGALVGTAATTANPINPVADDFLIGGHPSLTTNRWSGNIHTVSIYDRALHSSEVSDLYTQPYAAYAMGPTRWPSYYRPQLAVTINAGTYPFNVRKLA
jgi:hypothetical protein